MDTDAAAQSGAAAAPGPIAGRAAAAQAPSSGEARRSGSTPAEPATSGGSSGGSAGTEIEEVQPASHRVLQDPSEHAAPAVLVCYACRGAALGLACWLVPHRVSLAGWPAGCTQGRHTARRLCRSAAVTPRLCALQHPLPLPAVAEKKVREIVTVEDYISNYQQFQVRWGAGCCSSGWGWAHMHPQNQAGSSLLACDAMAGVRPLNGRLRHSHVQPQIAGQLPLVGSQHCTASLFFHQTVCTTNLLPCRWSCSSACSCARRTACVRRTCARWPRGMR